MALGIPRRVRLDRNAVARLQGVLVPTEASQLGCPVRFHLPLHGITRLVGGLHVEIDVGVPEVESRDGSLYVDDGVLIERDRAVMPCDGLGCQQNHGWDNRSSRN